MTKRSNEQSDFVKWSQLSNRWMNYLPPSRPSQNDLDIFRNLILKYGTTSKSINALVLGSTPEIRDLLCELDASVTVVDRNPHMSKEMNRFRIYNTAEVIHIDDWFNFLPKCKHSFDLIVSDLTQSNIQYDLHYEFYRSIAYALIPTGLFIDRVYTYRNYSELFSASIEFYQFSQNRSINLVALNDFFVKCFLASDLVANMGLIDTHRIYTEIRNLRNPILNKYADLLEEFLVPDGAVWYCGKHWSEISKTYFGHLSLLNETPTNGIPNTNIPYILCSTPKNY